jgi:hypothetical protein
MRYYIDSGNYKHPPRRPANADGRAGGSVAGSRLSDATLVNLMAMDGLIWCLGALLLLDKAVKG